MASDRQGRGPFCFARDVPITGAADLLEWQAGDASEPSDTEKGRWLFRGLAEERGHHLLEVGCRESGWGHREHAGAVGSALGQDVRTAWRRMGTKRPETKCRRP